MKTDRKLQRLSIACLMFFCLLVSCSSNRHYVSTKAHHTATGFKNIYYSDSKSFFDFIKWRWQRAFKDIPAGDDYHFEVVKTDHAALKNNLEKSTLTWIGHATFLIQLSSLNILTDPHFSERASPVNWAGPRRVVPPALEITDLPEIDVVVISHDHYDSLDKASVIALVEHNRQRSLTFIVPLGMKSWFHNIDPKPSQVVELDWGQSLSVGKVVFTAEPSQHWGKRTPFDAFKRLWASWVIEAEEKRIFFAGDTGYAEHFKEIGNKYGQFDLALLPIGAYEPRWFMQPYHVNPEESVKIHMDVNAKYSVAMHWGTFILTDEPLDEPPKKLAAALKKYRIDQSKFAVFKHGETRSFEDLFVKPDREQIDFN